MGYPLNTALRRYGWLRATTRRPVVRNAASLFGSTVVTSFLGFVFWLLAARFFSPAAVGLASAIQAASQLLAYVCIFGLGTLVIAELAESKHAARQLIMTTAVVTCVSGFLAGVAVGLVLRHLSADLRPGLTGTLRLAVFAGLSAATTTALLLDDASIGLLRGDIQFRRNTIFAVTKLALLAALGLAWSALGGMAILAACLIGLALSLVAVARPLVAATEPGPWRPALGPLVAKRRLIYSHHWLNISVIAPRQLLPVLVAAIISPAANAGFYAASLVVGFVNVIPSQLSTAMFALKPGDEDALREEVRETMKICVMVACLSAPFFIITSRFILEIFRHSYVDAAPAMAVLGFTTLPSAVKSYYVNIARVRRQMRRAATITSLAALVEVGATVGGAVLDGLTGVALGLLCAYLVETVWLGPPVAKMLLPQRVSGLHAKKRGHWW